MTTVRDRLSALSRSALKEGRPVLLEPELYEVLQAAGVSVPAHTWLRGGAALPATFTGRVVVKIVSPDILHKSDAGGVRFVEAASVTPDFLATFERDVAATWAKAHGRQPDVRGSLVMAAVDSDKTRLGAEVLLGLRHTRDFGHVGVIGLGGLKVELFGSRLPREEATALFAPDDVEGALVELKKTLVYRDLAGQLRGSTAAVTDATWRTLLALLSTLAQDADGLRLEEFEVNPLMLSRDGQLVAVDALARVSEVPPGPPARPLAKLNAFFKPRTVCVAGVSGKGVNMGRVILRNLLRDGFPVERLSVLKPGETEVDGVRCYPSPDVLPERADLAVLAVAAGAVPELLAGFIQHDKAQGLIVIPGGMAEKEGGAATQRKLEAMLAEARKTPGQGPLVLGPNSMGVVSAPGGYDTTFIPEHKLPRAAGPVRNLAFISQSGAFTITRASHLTQLAPRYLVSTGNQMDLTIGEVVDYVAQDDGVQVVAVYVEGFQPGDGRRFLDAARRARANGKRVILYQAGRSPEGAGTAAGHTASIAGDARVCWHLARAAGVLVAESFAEFEGLARVACALAGREVRGRRVMLMSNAGFEVVGMADNLRGETYALSLATLSATTKDAIRAALHRCRVDELVDVKNPLDVTPVAPDAVHLDIARAVLADDGVDALVLGVVPMSPALSTLAHAPDARETLAFPESLANTLPGLFRETRKPVVAVIDAGAHYEPLVRALEAGGVPVFRAADAAVRALGTWLCSEPRRVDAGGPTLPARTPQWPTTTSSRSLRGRGARKRPGRPDIAAALNRAALAASRTNSSAELYRAVADALQDVGFYVSLYELDGPFARQVTSSFSPRVVRAVERRVGVHQSTFRVALEDAPFFRRVLASDQAFLADTREVLHDIFPQRARWLAGPISRVFGIRRLVGTRIFAGSDAPIGLLFLLSDDVDERDVEPTQVFAQLLGSTLVRAQATARLAEKVAELEASKAQLAQAQKSEAIGRLTGGIAHDFNNLLTPAMWAVEQLERGVDARHQEDVGIVRDAIERCADLTRSLLAFGRRQVLTKRRIALDEAIAAALRLLRSTSPENVRLDWRPGAPGAFVDADVTQLHQVLINLGLNARDAMPEGGVFTVQTRVVTRPDGEWVELVCADTGVGISAAALPRVFEPFFTTKGPGKGSGLGLSVAEGIVRQHGGTIDVESQEGHGARFRVLLPRVAPPRPEAAGAGATTPTTGQRILVVEDDPQVRRVVTRVLRDAGHEVTSAATLAESRQVRERASFDLVVSDAVLSDGRSTDETLELWRRGQRVLFITGYPLDANWPAAERDRAPFLTKPFSPAELLAAVSAALAGRHVA